ncbi:MAG: murein hydrolase activator EnvC family protein [Thermoanaerobaculia bacterium]
MPWMDTSAGRFLLALGITLGLALALSAQTARKADLEKIKIEMSKLRTRLAEVQQQAKTAQQEFDEADIELGIRTRELEIAEDLEARLEEEQQSIQSQIVVLLARIETQKRYLGKRLGVLYRLGNLTYLRLFLSIDQRHNPLEAISMLSYLVGRDSRAVSRFQNDRVQLDARTADLHDRQLRLAQMKKVIEARQLAVSVARNEKQRLLQALQEEASGSKEQLADLEETARRLERLIGILSRNQIGDISGAADIRTVQGGLPWPVEGTVVERFGRQRNAKFATYTVSNGLRIAAAPGAGVQAVFRGTVLFSQWFKGYGNLIILDHGNRVLSLYGNLKAPAVAVGDRIEAGQTIAGIAEAEDQQSGSLYFEIRQDNRPEDPQKWLR